MSLINSVQFGVLSPEEIEKYAVCKITTTKLKNSEYGSLNDIRMGPSKNKESCGTCGEDNIKCPGHFGYIDLKRKVINPLFITVIENVLKTVCSECSCFLIHHKHFDLMNFADEDDEYSLLRSITEECKKISHCQSCGSYKIQWRQKDGVFTTFIEIKDEDSKKKKPTKKTIVTEKSVDDIYNILRKISDETLNVLGFNRNLTNKQIYKEPKYFINSTMKHRHQIRIEWMIMTKLLVLPPSVRPSIMQEYGEIQDDDLTDKYIQIFKEVTRLENETNSEKIKIYEAKLIEHINTLFDNTKEKSKIKINNRAHKCLKTRLVGKEGHVRMINAKRCDYTARTVIDAGPNLKFNQISVPKSIAETITYPVLVTPNKLEYYRKMLLDGKINFIKKIDKNFKTKNVRVNKENIHSKINTINVGDTVERQLKTGDFVIMNRQPTLRVESMNAHEVVVCNDPNEKVFRLNLSTCNGYNADFDGDEMNIHFPQNDMAMAEVRTLMDIRDKICSSQSNSPVAGLVQDSLVGLYFLSKIETRVPLHIFYDCLLAIGCFDRIQEVFQKAYKYYKKDLVRVQSKSTGKIRVRARNKKDLSGRILLSFLFPGDFYYYSKNNDPEDLVGTQEGIVEIKNGILVKGDLVKKVLGAKHNSIVHILCIEYNKFVVSDFISNAQFLCHRWFTTYSFSFGLDSCLNTKSEEIKDEINKMYEKCHEISISNKSKFDKEILLNNELNNALTIGQSLSKDGLIGGIDNAMVVCTYTGAKGSYVNSCQISALLGQQNSMGARSKKTLTNQTRCLPVFEPEDDNPLARGFIDRSFIDGLTPSQFFFHAQSGREGLMDTAVKTQDSGYTQRKVGKKMENYKVEIDGSVRNSDGTIIQFIYGDEGFNPKELYNVKGKPFFIDIERLANRLNYNYDNCYGKNHNTKKTKLMDKHIDVILMKIRIFGNVENDVIKYATKKIHEILRTQLKNIEIYEDTELIKNLIDTITLKFNKSRIEPGDMVGIIASCSIGEIATQKTLNSFHHTGTSSKAVTTGIPRLNELMNATRNPKTPSTIVYLNEDTLVKKHNQLKNDITNYELKQSLLEDLQSYRSTFEYSTFKDFVVKKELKYIKEELFSEDEGQSEIPENTPISLYKYEEFKEEWWFKSEDISVNKWVCEFTIDLKKLFYFKLTLEDLKRKCEEKDEFDNYVFVCSPLSIGKMIMITNYDNIDDVHLKALEESNKNIIINEQNWYYYYTRDVIIDFIYNVPCTGIIGVEKIFPIINNDEFYLDVQGKNFEEIIQHKFIDFVKTSSDDIWEVYNVLGIEATRDFLIEELEKVLSSDGTYINNSHYMLLADSMTHEGIISSVSRFGINRDVGPLTKAAFEEALGNVVTAAVFGEVDDMNSVTSNISFGNLCRMGTMNRSFDTFEEAKKNFE